MVKIKVPATTANFGPCFDTIGLALNLFQEITIEKRVSNDRIVEWVGPQLLDDASNLVFIALNKTLSLFEHYGTGYTLTMLESTIPISRGLGSSAAAIVSGIYAANFLMDYALTQQEIIDIATSIEGHPDNVVPAILGNLSLALTSDQVTHHSSIDFPDDLQLKVFVPDYEISTSHARSVLPETYSLKQCVHNISRVSFLIHALHTQNYELLSLGLDDVIHEPYRIKLIEDADLILNEIKKTEALGWFISGAGPTIVAITTKKDLAFNKNITLNTVNFKHSWNCFSLEVNKSGAVYEMIK